MSGQLKWENASSAVLQKKKRKMAVLKVWMEKNYHAIPVYKYILPSEGCTGLHWGKDNRSRSLHPISLEDRLKQRKGPKIRHFTKSSRKFEKKRAVKAMHIDKFSPV